MPPFFSLKILKKTPLFLGYFFYALRLLLGTYFNTSIDKQGVMKQDYLLHAQARLFLEGLHWKQDLNLRWVMIVIWFYKG